MSGYTLLRLLGRGGMGEVYEAQEHDPPRRVALKLVSAGRLSFEESEASAHFAIERVAVARMDHPNVARVYKAGVTADRAPFFAMELVDGPTLMTYCDARDLSVRERLRLFVGVCKAVQHAHQKGVIHRDLKPGNILVTEVDGRPVPKVIDFGVAKVLGEGGGPGVTRHGFVAGTPLYMAPEQAAVCGLVDTRADVWALGVILFQLLTGRTPLDRDELNALPPEEVLSRVYQQVPPRPSEIVPADLAARLSGELDWIVCKCLRHDPNERYATADQLADDIERYSRDEPVTARPPSGWYSARKFVRRNRGPVAAVTAMLFLLVAGGAGTSLGMITAHEERRQADGLRRQAEDLRTEAELQRALAVARAEAEAKAREEATAARERADREALSAETVLGFLINELIAPIDPHVRLPRQKGPNTDVTLGTILARAAGRIDSGLVKVPAIRTRLREVLCMAYLAIGRADVAVKHAEKLAADLGHPPDPADPKERRFALTSARSYSEGGLPAKAEPIYHAAVLAVVREEGENGPNVRGVKQELANCLLLAGKPAEAERLMTGLLDSAGPKPADRLLPASNLAALYSQTGQFDKVIDLLSGMMSDKQIERGDELAIAGARGCLARAYQEFYRFDDARPLATAVAATYRNKYGADHLLTLGAVGELASIEVESGQFDVAEKLFSSLIPQIKSVHGANHPSLFGALGNQGVLYERTKQFDKAAAVHRDRIGVCGKAFGANSTNAAVAELDLAFVLAQQDKWAEAEPIVRHSLKVFEKLTPDDWDTVKARLLLATTLEKVSKSDEVETLLLAAARWVTDRPKTAPPPTPDEISAVLSAVTEFYRGQGKKFEEAKWRGERAKRVRETLPPPRVAD